MRVMRSTTFAAILAIIWFVSQTTLAFAHYGWPGHEGLTHEVATQSGQSVVLADRDHVADASQSEDGSDTRGSTHDGFPLNAHETFCSFGCFIVSPDTAHEPNLSDSVATFYLSFLSLRAHTSELVTPPPNA